MRIILHTGECPKSGNGQPFCGLLLGRECLHPGKLSQLVEFIGNSRHWSENLAGRGTGLIEYWPGTVFWHRSWFEDLIEHFRRQAAECMPGIVGKRIDGAGFGAAGAVVEGRLYANNFPWALNLPELARGLDLSSCEPGRTAAERNSSPDGCRHWIGRGVSLLGWRKVPGVSFRGWPGRFSPREREIQLLVYLNKRLPHVCCEVVLSGRGIRAIHEFLDPDLRHPSFDGSGADAAREITQQASRNSCPVCVDTLDLWTEAYGSEAGNVALRALALGGVYIAGGIAPKILVKITDGDFLRAFCDKTKLSPVLARIPIYVVLNEDAPVWGAAYQALAVAHLRQVPHTERKAG